MKNGRVIMEYHFYPSYYYLLLSAFLSLTAELPLAAEQVASTRCGCIETDKLRAEPTVASMVLGPPTTYIQITKCDLFCGSKSAARFLRAPSEMCTCYGERLATFDCDEVSRTGFNTSSVLPVYCVSSVYSKYFPQSNASSLAVREEGSTRENEKDENVSGEEGGSFAVSRGIAPAAIVLGVISLVVLVLLGIKTLVENQRSKRKGGDEKNSPPRVSSSWNFNEDKLKETRFENNV